MSVIYDGHGGYRFGDFTVDVDRRELTRDGDRLKIRPKSFDVLEYLLDQRGKLVGRDELLETLWAGTVVTEDAVTQCLKEIRRAIGDDDQTMIRTVPRRGYIFEAPVEVLGETGDSTTPRVQPAVSPGLLGRVAVAAAAITAVAAVLWMSTGSPDGDTDEQPQLSESVSESSIAILPFAVMSADETQTYFADGIAEEIINSLTRQPGLKVIARTSSFSFRGQNVDVTTIASRLDVSHVLEGSIRSDGDALRINVQLVDAGTGEYVWTEQFDRALSAAGVFEVQSEIATEVVQSLRTELSPEVRASLSRIPTDVLPALDAYFEARQLMETRRSPDLDRAAELLRSAIDRDPDFALAYVALADTLRLQSGYGSLPWSVADEEGMAAIETALRIDDRLGEAYASLGNLLGPRGDKQGAEAAFLRGIELSPGYAPLYQWYGEFLWKFGARPAEGARYARIAAALDPRSAIINTDYGAALVAAGRFGEAQKQYDLVVEMDPNFARVWLDKGVLLIRAFGRLADGVAALERAEELSPFPDTLAWQSSAYMDLGDLDRAREALDAAERLDSDSPGVLISRFVFDVLYGETGLESAQSVLDVWPWWAPSLRFLRDYELTDRGIDAAFEVYRPTHDQLLGDEPPIVGPDNFAVAIDISYLLMLAGRQERVEQILSQCRGFIEALPRQAWIVNSLADVRIEAILGNHERALELLERAVDEGWRLDWKFELEHDLALAELREHRGYADIVAKIRADMERQRDSLAGGSGAASGGVD